MFAKLLKHEFNSVKKTMFILCGAGLGAGVLGALLVLVLENSTITDQNILLAIVTMLFMVGTILTLVGCCAAMPIILWVRFYKNKFSDEGYLTFTLPVTSHQILLSSLLNILIWMLISLLVAVISIVLILSPTFRYVDLNDINYVIDSAFSDSFGSYYLLTMLLGSVCSTVYSVVIPPMCITIGAQIAKKYKLLAGFGIYYALSMVVSFVAGILTAITSLGTGSFLNDTGEYAALYATIIPFIIQLCFGIGGYFIMHRSIERKLNLP